MVLENYNIYYLMFWLKYVYYYSFEVPGFKFKRAFAAANLQFVLGYYVVSYQSFR